MKTLGSIVVNADGQAEIIFNAELLDESRTLWLDLLGDLLGDITSAQEYLMDNDLDVSMDDYIESLSDNSPHFTVQRSLGRELS